MKRHIPAECYCHGDEECVVCGARRQEIQTKSLFRDFRYTPWLLDGKPAPYCPGKKEEKA